LRSSTTKQVKRQRERSLTVGSVTTLDGMSHPNWTDQHVASTKPRWCAASVEDAYGLMPGEGGVEDVKVVRQFNHCSRQVGTVIRVDVVCCPKGAFGPMR
jgi:hypothetical protein